VVASVTRHLRKKRAILRRGFAELVAVPQRPAPVADRAMKGSATAEERLRS